MPSDDADLLTFERVWNTMLESDRPDTSNADRLIAFERAIRKPNPSFCENKDRHIQHLVDLGAIPTLITILEAQPNASRYDCKVFFKNAQKIIFR